MNHISTLKSFHELASGYHYENTVRVAYYEPLGAKRSVHIKQTS